jgi:amidophosphoribosyltransferase
MDETQSPSDAKPDARPHDKSNPARRYARFDPNGDGDTLREECGVFGIFGHPDAAAITALGLHALQHRGQEAAGIVSFDGKRFHSERRLGLVGDTFLAARRSSACPARRVGHVRYSTTGETILRNVQPLFAELNAGGFAVGHNGNLTNGLTLRRELVREGAMMQSTTDTEVILHLGAQSQAATASSTASSRRCAQIEGAYALVALTNKKLIGARDPLGIRPLVLGELDGCPILARRPARSTSSAPNSSATSRTAKSSCSTKTARRATSRSRPAAAALHLRIHLFFAARFDRRRPLGLRRAQGDGRELAREAPPRPMSSCRCRIPACRRRSATPESGMPFELGIIRNHYVGRTFIQPTQSDPRTRRALKHNANRAASRASASC